MIETKLNGTTPDIAEENIAKLKEIFPDVFCEGKVDFEKLQQVLGNYVEDAKERYNFSWNGKGKALKLAQSPSTGTLLPCKEESKDWDTTENLYIEGDNLEVLKLLQKSYHNKIKMIYIDPPYNTGHDFVYKDNFKDNLQNYLEITGQTDEEGNKLTTNSESSGRYHTDWLNMMYPRLRLARNLLTDDGVIFISIDDNEVGNLRKVCNEIFGEDNFIAEFIWQKKSSGGQHANFVLDFHEYILCYAKNIEMVEEISVERTSEQLESFTLEDEFVNSRGKYLLSPLKSWLDYRKTLIYDIECPDGSKINTQWVCSETTFFELKKESRIVFKQNNKGEWSVYKKQYSNENGGRVKPASMITQHGQTANGKRQIKDLFGKDVMSFPKPLELIKYIVSMINNNALILDFFSGSATTAHAVMQLNAEDGGNRKFICVQLPESCDESSEAFKAGYKNICEIGKERIRRAGEKIKSEIESANVQISLGEDEKKVPDIGFKVFKLNSSNIKRWQPDFDEIEDYISLMENNFVDDRTELDVVYEIMIKYGLDLTYPVEELSCGDTTLYSIGMGMLIICLANNIGADVAKFISDYKKENEIDGMRVVFADGCFGGNDSLKTNIKEILKVAGVEEFITI